MSNLKIIGFYRCTGFDHLVRFVTDAKGNDEFPYTVMQDGYRVQGGRYTSAELLPISDLSDVPEMNGKSEQSEYAACNAWINSGYANPDAETPPIDG